MHAPLLDVEDLRTYFITDDGVVRAVDGVTFSIAEGERVGIVGESGSGKSVTAASIMGLIDPPGAVVGGAIRFRGYDLVRAPEKEMEGIRGQQIAMIFQDPMTALDPVFTIGSQMTETLMLHQRLSRRDAREIAIDTLSAVHIPDPARRFTQYPHEFSGGMRQRVVVAMGLLCNPALLIADEPTTALDVTSQAQVLDLMLTLADERGTAVMLITHDLGVVAGFCERVQVMYAGRIVEQSNVADLFADPGHPYSSGLLRSVPRLDSDEGALLSPIPGTPPSLIAPPTGCSFWPRCEHTMDACRETSPQLAAVGRGRKVACHLVDQAPFALDRSR